MQPLEADARLCSVAGYNPRFIGQRKQPFVNAAHQF